PGRGQPGAARRQGPHPPVAAGHPGRGHRSRRRGLFRPGRPRADFRRRNTMSAKNYETILVPREDRVGIITLNRPKALNALNSQVMTEVTDAAAEFDSDPGIRSEEHTSELQS